MSTDDAVAGVAAAVAAAADSDDAEKRNPPAWRRMSRLLLRA